MNRFIQSILASAYSKIQSEVRLLNQDTEIAHFDRVIFSVVNKIQTKTKMELFYARTRFNINNINYINNNNLNGNNDNNNNNNLI